MSIINGRISPAMRSVRGFVVFLLAAISNENKFPIHFACFALYHLRRASRSFAHIAFPRKRGHSDFFKRADGSRVFFFKLSFFRVSFFFLWKCNRNYFSAKNTYKKTHRFSDKHIRVGRIGASTAWCHLSCRKARFRQDNAGRLSCRFQKESREWKQTPRGTAPSSQTQTESRTRCRKPKRGSAHSRIVLEDPLSFFPAGAVRISRRIPKIHSAVPYRPA
jgi:hypothetical protein